MAEEKIITVLPPNTEPTVNIPSPYSSSRLGFIQYVANNKGWTLGVELGVKRGCTFLHLLNHCPQLTMIGVDLWQEQPDNPGPENYVNWPHQKYETYVRKMSEPFGSRAIIIKDSTDNAVKRIQDNTLDFVFIDADHSSEAVERDIRNWHPKIKDKGWIIGHDINWDTIQPVVERLVPNYIVAHDNVWARPKGELNTPFLGAIDVHNS